MSEVRLSADYVGYRDAAAAILSRHSGMAAVEAFGLADVFEAGDFTPAFAFLEAQGRLAVTTPALGLLGADRYPLVLALPLGDSLLAVTGPADRMTIAVHRSNSGLGQLDAPATRPLIDQPADDYLHLLLGQPPAEPLPEEILARVRIGICAEIVGVCTRLLDDAIAYAGTRSQFGKPIGDFQAVQHLLAWAATEVHQLLCLYDIAIQQPAADPELARTAKALAGRVLHAVAQIAIQVTGAISFTWEYSLNRLHHRGLALDQLAGSSAELVADLGRAARTSGVLPALFDLADVTVTSTR